MPLPPLLPGEFAWRCDAVALDAAGVVTGVMPFDAAARAVLAAEANRLYLEIFDRGDGGVWLVHRGGWPFELRTVEGDPVGRDRKELRPVGAGR